MENQAISEKEIRRQLKKERGSRIWAVIMVVIFLLFMFFVLVVPNMCFHGHRRPRQSEAKTNLASIATASIAYFADNRKWGTSFKLIGWEPYGKTKYTYFLSPTEYIGRPPEELGISIPLRNAFGAPMPGVSEEGFTAVAIGNIDDDDTLDVWWIDQRKDPRNAQNDVNE